MTRLAKNEGKEFEKSGMLIGLGTAGSFYTFKPIYPLLTPLTPRERLILLGMSALVLIPLLSRGHCGVVLPC
jgi:hypothetical protein